jgi:hypothetical protein
LYANRDYFNTFNKDIFGWDFRGVLELIAGDHKKSSIHLKFPLIFKFYSSQFTVGRRKLIIGVIRYFEHYATMKKDSVLQSNLESL